VCTYLEIIIISIVLKITHRQVENNSMYIYNKFQIYNISEKYIAADIVITPLGLK
jgi:hypothetical protein